MKQRRILLVLGGLGLVVSAACPAEAGTSAEVEGGAYGGTASGAWACGPTAQVKYGGLGARGRVWLDDPTKVAVGAASAARKAPEGFSVGGGVSGEMRRYKLLDCHGTGSSTEPCAPEDTVVPGSGLTFGAQASVGYDAGFVGGRLGVLGFQRHKESNAPRSVRLLPDLQLRVGDRTSVHGELGTGAYSIDTIQRPALLYVGITVPASPSVELSARLGNHLVLDEHAAVRGDLSATLRLGNAMRIGVGGGASQGISQLTPHGRLTLGGEF